MACAWVATLAATSPGRQTGWATAMVSGSRIGSLSSPIGRGDRPTTDDTGRSARQGGRDPRPGEGAGRGSDVVQGQTRPFGTVCQYVLLKTILPRCHSWFGFGGRGGWS